MSVRASNHLPCTPTAAPVHAGAVKMQTLTGGSSLLAETPSPRATLAPCPTWKRYQFIFRRMARVGLKQLHAETRPLPSDADHRPTTLIHRDYRSTFIAHTLSTSLIASFARADACGVASLLANGVQSPPCMAAHCREMLTVTNSRSSIVITAEHSSHTLCRLDYMLPVHSSTILPRHRPVPVSPHWEGTNNPYDPVNNHKNDDASNNPNTVNNPNEGLITLLLGGATLVDPCPSSLFFFPLPHPMATHHGATAMSTRATIPSTLAGSGTRRRAIG